MVTFPKFLTGITDAETQRKRQLQLNDCAPGDLVYLPGRGDTNLHVVVKAGGNPDNKALIAFTVDGPAYVLTYYDEPVIRLEHSAWFVVDQTSRQMSGQGQRIGAVRTSHRGTCLFVKQGQQTDGVGFDLETFAFCSSGSGVEFTRWSVEISDDSRRMVLFEFSI